MSDVLLINDQGTDFAKTASKQSATKSSTSSFCRTEPPHLISPADGFPAWGFHLNAFPVVTPLSPYGLKWRQLYLFFFVVKPAPPQFSVFVTRFGRAGARPSRIATLPYAQRFQSAIDHPASREERSLPRPVVFSHGRDALRMGHRQNRRQSVTAGAQIRLPIQTQLWFGIYHSIIAYGSVLTL